MKTLIPLICKYNAMSLILGNNMNMWAGDNAKEMIRMHSDHDFIESLNTMRFPVIELVHEKLLFIIILN